MSEAFFVPLCPTSANQGLAAAPPIPPSLSLTISRKTMSPALTVDAIAAERTMPISTAAQRVLLHRRKFHVTKMPHAMAIAWPRVSATVRRLREGRLMKTPAFQNELARQLSLWAEQEQFQDGRQDVMRLAQECEQIAATRPVVRVTAEDQRKAA